MNLIPHYELSRRILQTSRDVVRRLLVNLEPPPDISTYEWANTYRFVAKGVSATPGKFNTELTPYMEAVYDAIDDPKNSVIVAQKSAQIAWTETINNKIGKHADIDPLGCIVMFPKEGAAKSFEREKLVKMIEATPTLKKRINTSRSKASGNTWDYKQYDGGFIKLVSSNSPASVKSTAAELLIVEEPDDANTNVKGQGDTLKLLEDRGDTFENSTMIFGGTPTIKGISQVEAAYKKSDQRVYMVPCHHCEEEHELSFDYLDCLSFEDDYKHEVFGHLNPETAFYTCPHCGGVWDDFNKNRNVTRAKERHNKGWLARERSDVPGFRFNALMSPFPGARFAKLMAKRLDAEFKFSQGDDSALIAFTNTRKGMPYEFGDSNIEADDLREKALVYRENTVPRSGLILTAGVDVQHDRLHILIRAWGRNEQSYLVARFVLYGVTSQKSDAVWHELDKTLWHPFTHESGAGLIVSAVSIDSSDGNTSDAVYSWVAARVKRGVMAIKGSNSYDAPIFKNPTKKNRKHKSRSKAERYGVEVYLVGTNNAKDLIIGSGEKTGRIRLTQGAGAMFWYQDVAPEYYDQLLGEVKAPHRTLKNRLVWQRKAGQAVEDLDCEVYALHAARRLRIHLMTDEQWKKCESQILQTDLFNKNSTETPVAIQKRRKKRVSGGV